MRKIKVCYTDRKNLGDAINPLIIRDVLNAEHEISNAYFCDVTGIGSGLRRYFVDMSNYKGQCKYLVGHLTNKPLVIWSAGFLKTPTGNEEFIRKSFKVASTRGELSKNWVEKILKCEIECTTGDAGLLTSELIEKQEKKYAVGIIPHVKEKNEELFLKLKEQIPNSVYIDVEDNPIEVIKTISSCESILSSSLHGLIISDSFSIPNLHVICTDKLSGDGFKFHDYYSSFGLRDNSVNIRQCMNITMQNIVDSYAITPAMVDEKKLEIKEAFNRYL